MPCPWVVSELTALGASDSLGCLPVERVRGTREGHVWAWAPGSLTPSQPLLAAVRLKRFRFVLSDNRGKLSFRLCGRVWERL